MTARRPPDVKVQLHELNLILWAAWDPIGCGVPTDEYARYAAQILPLVRTVSESDAECGSFDALVAELSRLRIETMCLRPDPEADSDTALKLCDWYGW